MNENMTNLQNENTQTKRDFEKLDNLLSKERQESILNFRLTLRKKKIYNYLMDSRTKNEVKKNDSKINSRKKLFECKKLFEKEKIKETVDKIISDNQIINYLKDKNTIELIQKYSMNINSNENVKNIFDSNIDKLIQKFLYEIKNDINSKVISNFELFDYYLIILGNLFIYKKSIFDNNTNEYFLLFLNILNMNSNLDIYNDYNFEIINDTLWLIHLYIYFSIQNTLSFSPYIIKSINNLFTNKFFEELINFNNKNKKIKANLVIIRQIIYTSLKIYLLLIENLLEIKNFKKININIEKEDMQHCLDILIKFLDFNLLKDEFIRDITNIILLILEFTGNKFNLNLNQFYNIYVALFEKYKNYDYDNNDISENLILILLNLIDKYNEDNYFFQILNDSDIIPICIQYYLKNGYIIDVSLKALNILFKYQFNYHKIIIKSINYQLLDKVCEILINTDNKETIFCYCLKILIDAYSFLENNMKNNSNENILKYFDLKIIPKIEQLILHNDKYVCEAASFLYKKFKNINN